MYNILIEPLIRIDTSGRGRVAASLPQVYAALMADEVEAFPALRPHQRHAWHAFLVQLGAMAMRHAGLEEPPETAEEWARIIPGLTPDWCGDEPWQLVVEDITSPAFMQPRASSKDKEKEFNKEVLTPDELDIIGTSRNHDVKTGSLYDSEEDNWIFALINMQTMDGNPGRGYYGVSRMNSNDGSRTAFSLTPSLRWGRHVLKDISSLLEADFSDWPMQWDKVKLLWTEPWDGMKSEGLTLDKLYPFYLEVCRRCRIKKGSRGLYAVKSPKAKDGGCRVAAETSRGNVGDPWTLVTEDDKGLKALTMQTDSFSYRNIVSYLFDPAWKLPALFELGNSGKEGDGFLVARGLRRKRGGQTEGYYERVIPLRPAVARVFGRGGDRQALGDIARRRVTQVGKVEEFLRYAVAVFVAKGEDLSKLKPQDRNKILYKDETTTQVEGFTKVVDDFFFDHLQTEFEVDSDTEREHIRAEWLKDFVVPSADGILVASWESVPCPESQRIKAIATSKNVFNSLIYQEFEVSFN